MDASYTSYRLKFIRPGGTSRGVLTEKETFFITLRRGAAWGIGECPLFRGLSRDDRPGYEERLQWACHNIGLGLEALRTGLADWPSLVFGLEQAFRSLEAASPMELFPSDFLRGRPIPINGLIWMGDLPFMEQQIGAKLAEGYRCLKLKIGALDFDRELELLRGLRRRFSTDELELRVDANGAFRPEEAAGRLQELAELGLHSIEQPIRAGQWEAMARLCRESPLPIALDEELIAIGDPARKRKLLEEVSPQFLILKPGLLGGFRACEEWIGLAESLGIGWWVTSALESNIGLSAIAQWTATLETEMPQGLGTGALFSNNFDSPLRTADGYLWYDTTRAWELDKIQRLCT